MVAPSFTNRAVVLAAFALVTAPLSAATPAGSVKQVRGTVLIDRNQGYQPLPNGASVAAGDRLIVLEGASAVLVSPTGCVFRLQENTLLELAEPKNCRTAVKPIAGVYLAQAIGLEVPGEVQSDVPTGGFGAIGADAPRSLTPKEVKKAVDLESREAAAREAAPLPEAPPEFAPAVATDADKQKPASSALARTPAPRPMESVAATPAVVSGGLKLAGIIGGGVAVVAALAGAGGGGGDHGTPPPPLSPQ